MSPADLNRRQAIRDQLREALRPFSGVQPADQTKPRISVGAVRRGVRPRGGPVVHTMTLVEVDGVLAWEDGSVLVGPARGLRRGYRAGAGGTFKGNVVERVQIEELGINEIGQHLADLDQRLTPAQGLRLWDGKALGAPAREKVPASSGRILLFVHGTFSNCDRIFEELRATAEGREFLARAHKKYTQVLAFDHPTVSISPVWNALDLARRFAGTKAEIDVICHSRGGLVARWWLELLDREPNEPRRAVLVGCPLSGTSLAAPPRLRHLFSWFHNLNEVLSAGAASGSALLPFLTVISGLLQIAASVSSAIANTSLVDAGVALIPGLAAMSRIDNNPELNRLNVSGQRGSKYFVIQSSFEPPPVGWKFWNAFVDLKAHAAAAGSGLIFRSANDLVVDTQSMTVVGPDLNVPEGQVYDFGTTSRVYHTNYFQQPETLQFISRSLEIS